MFCLPTSSYSFKDIKIDDCHRGFSCIQFIKFDKFQESKIQFEKFTRVPYSNFFFYLLLLAFLPESSLTMVVCWISRRKKTFHSVRTFITVL